MLDNCQREYGDVFSLRGMGDRAFVVVGTPELIRKVLAADPDVLLAGKSNETLLEPMLGKSSLLTLDGREHLRQRRLLLPAFHGDRMHAFADTMREITEASFASWPLHRPFALHPFMQSITLDVIMRTVFGTPDRTLREQLVELLDVVSNPWLMLPGFLRIDPFKFPWLRITKLKRAVDDSIYRLIATRRREPGGNDVLAMMLAARDEDGNAMTDVELRDELVTLLLAGHETTATSLAWTFDCLLSNPATYSRLAEGDPEYVDAVLRETLRLRPIVPMIGRIVAKPFELGPWTLPVGSQIAPSIYLAGHRPDAYPEPRKFKPERWLGVKPDPYSWLPFGGGTRRCIGMAFALFEMRIVLDVVVPRARMRLAGKPATVVRRGITLAPSGGTQVILDERRAAPPSRLRSRA